MNTEKLYQIVNQTLAPGKGVLASDESPPSVERTLSHYNIEPNEHNILKYRELFINAPVFEKYVNAMIISEPTFWQADTSGKLLRDTLTEKGILICVKVDNGLEKSPEFGGQQLTKGLDGLSERLVKLSANGAKLAKWRSLIAIGEGIPTLEYLDRLTQDLGSYALACQQNNIVPIVEPEVDIKGNHTIEQTREVSESLLKMLFTNLEKMQVDLAGLILKTNMVTPGSESTQDATPEQIAQNTVAVLMASVPRQVGGILFLSGGQDPDEATTNFNAIAKNEPLPWELAFSFLRAIEGPPAEIWAGKDENVTQAREKFMEMLRQNVLADSGLFA